jgi:hypothetical protein
MLTRTITMVVPAGPAPLTLDRLEADVRYVKALQLVERVDARLEQGQHFRDSGGRLLLSLDEVIRAILDGRLEVMQ